MFKVVFMWDIKQEESSFFSFYSSLPDTLEDNFRYLHAKYLLLRGGRNRLVTGPQQPDILADYYSKMVLTSTFSPGDVYKLYQLRGESHECQILDGKVVIPALWILDENFFVLGHFDKERKEVRIIMSIKYKHIQSLLVTRKEKIMLQVSVRGYDYRSERLRFKNSLVVRGIEGLHTRMIACQIKVREREMVFISSSIRRTEELLPVPSLL